MQDNTTPKISVPKEILICGGDKTSVTLHLTECKTASEVLAYVTLSKMSCMPGENIIC